MTRLEIAAGIAGHITWPYNSLGDPVVVDLHLQQCLDLADRLIQLDQLRTHKIKADADKARKEFHDRIDVAHGKITPADRVAELTIDDQQSLAKYRKGLFKKLTPKPMSTRVPSGGYTRPKKPNWIERFFSGGGK